MNRMLQLLNLWKTRRFVGAAVAACAGSVIYVDFVKLPTHALLAYETPPWRRIVQNQTELSAKPLGNGTKQQGEHQRNILRVEFEPGKTSLLGEGTFGTVRKARETTTGRTVALKIVHRNAKSLSHEIGALKKVRELGGHPNVVSLLGVVKMEDDSSKFGLVFELLEGGELYESLVKSGAYSESSASAVIRQVASALAFLHGECNIAHADLKPENLLLRTKDGKQIAICDFGSAVELDADGTFELSENRLLGTVAYAAPELLVPYENPSGDKSNSMLSASIKRISQMASSIQHELGVTHRATPRASSAVDVWSLGCILYVILSGMHPFDPDNELTTDDELAKSILKGSFDFSASAWRDVSSSAKDLIRKMLERDPAKRIGAKEVLEHDWIRLPQRQEIISNSDVRLIGFLRTQKRLQDHVFHLMLDGSLKAGGRGSMSSSPASSAPSQSSNGDIGSRSLECLYRTIDLEGKGFITRQDLERTLGKSSKTEATSSPSASVEEEDKLYYSSLNGLVGCGERVAYEPGQTICRQGDRADAFYFIDRGKVEVMLDEDSFPASSPGATTKKRTSQETKSDTPNKEDEGTSRRPSRIAAHIGAGDFFGETALIKNQPRNATVRAGPKGVELIRFSRDDFDRLVAGSTTTFKMLDETVKRRTVEHIKFIFSSMFNDNETVHLGQGGVLLKRGEPSDSMYYIAEGIVDVISSSGEIVAQRHEGETVGELGLVTGEPRSMDIVCSSKNGCAFKQLNQDDLQRLLRFSPLAHAELTNALSTRGGTSHKEGVTRENSLKSSNATPSSTETMQKKGSSSTTPMADARSHEMDIRRRWTIVQGTARHVKPSSSAASYPQDTGKQKQQSS